MNYAEHNKELNGGVLVKPESPVLFMKPDSAILKGGKPFFIPDFAERFDYEAELVVRISKLGKNIAPRFAHRYYDAIAPGMDFVAMDILAQAQHDQRSWTKALAFDYSLALGQWIAKEEWEKAQKDEQFSAEPIIRPEEAIAEVSKWMTIRQGDLIYIQQAQPPRAVQMDEVITATINGEQKLYCKIK